MTDLRRALRPAAGQVSVTRVVVLGLVSGLLYVAMYLAQRPVHAGPTGDAFAAGLALYPVSLLGLFALYGLRARTVPAGLSRGLRLPVFGLPVIFSLFWLLVAPGLLQRRLCPMSPTGTSRWDWTPTRTWSTVPRWLRARSGAELGLVRLAAGPSGDSLRTVF